MVRINGDFNEKVIIQSDELEWKPSRYPGVSRRCDICSWGCFCYYRSLESFPCYNRKAEVEQEPQTTKQARNLKSSTFTRMAQQHHHDLAR